MFGKMVTESTLGLVDLQEGTSNVVDEVMRNMRCYFSSLRVSSIWLWRRPRTAQSVLEWEEELKWLTTGRSSRLWLDRVRVFDKRVVTSSLGLVDLPRQHWEQRMLWMEYEVLFFQFVCGFILVLEEACGDDR